MLFDNRIIPIVDNTVRISGLSTGTLKILYGAGKEWQLWSEAGKGYQSGRDWRYGESSLWFVRVSGNRMEFYKSFSVGHHWRFARKIGMFLIDVLNEGKHTEDVFVQTHKYLEDYKYEYDHLTHKEKIDATFDMLLQNITGMSLADYLNRK